MFARRAIVAQHRWMNADEFNETFARPTSSIWRWCSRLRGIAGAVAACAGLLLPRTLIMTMLAIIYASFGDLDALRRRLAGISSCAPRGCWVLLALWDENR